MENENIKLFNKSFSNIPAKTINKKKLIIDKLINFFVYILILILLIINSILFYLLFSKNNKYLYDMQYNITNNTGNYSLYYLFKYPQISILLPNIENLNATNNLINDFIINLMNQTLKNIQIIISFSTIKCFTYYNNIYNFSAFDNQVNMYYLSNQSFLSHLYYLIENSKGKFILIIDKIEKFEYNEIEKFYKTTKGKINSYFSFVTKNGSNIYLIKSKILKNIIDKDLKFKNYSEIINYLFNLTININYISIALCPDNYYTPYAYVGMLSILDTKFYYTYVSFYLIITDDFEQKNIDFLYSLYDQYDLFNITFIYMDNRYNIAYISRYLTKQTYYRFSLGNLIPYLNNII